MNSVMVKRGFILVFVVIACLVVGLWTYWTVQRNEVTKAAQVSLDADYHTTVHINQVKLDAAASVSKLAILPFRQHQWIVLYRVPQQENATSMAIGQVQHGQWVYERTAPSGQQG